MAHELAIDEKTGEAMMMYTGQLPWHGLGQKIEGKAATAAQAIEAAHLDWDVSLYNMKAYDNSGTEAVVPDKYAVVRDDTWESNNKIVLGVVGNRYVPLQNRDAFGFFDGIVGKGQAIYHTAGALGDGQRVWILAKLPDDIVLPGEDITNMYMLLSNSHDGTSSIEGMLTPVRVVCNNTLTMALQKHKHKFNIRHTASAGDKLNVAAKAVGFMRKQSGELQELFGDMARKQMNVSTLKGYFDSLWPEPDTQVKTRKEVTDGDEIIKSVGDDMVLVGSSRAYGNWERRRDKLAEIFQTAPGCTIQQTRGTLWSAYNAVTEYVDHHSRNFTTADNRMSSLVFGSSASKKADALELAASLLN